MTSDPPVQHTAFDRPALLARHPFFSSLSADELKSISRELQNASFAPGTVFVREGDPGDCVYVIVAGQVEIIKALGSPAERSFGMRSPGDTLGEMSLIDPDERRSASVRAISAVEALVITRQQFPALLAQYPQLSLQMLRILSHRLRASENATIRDLQERNQKLSDAYLELKVAQQKIVEQEVLAHELAHAQRIQLQMLPAELPRLVGAEIGAAIRSARSVGGDLYEVIRLDEMRVALAIGDVAGKGIPAALYMALVSSLLRAEAEQGDPPETVVRRVNHHLCARDLDSMFVTLAYAELNVQTRQLQIVRAGHEHPLLWSDRCAIPLPEGGRAMPLGLVNEVRLDVQQIALPAAATFVLYTDGATDAVSVDGKPFGRARLISTIEHNLHLPPQPFCDAVVDTILAYHGVAPQFDDVTLVAVHLD